MKKIIVSTALLSSIINLDSAIASGKWQLPCFYGSMEANLKCSLRKEIGKGAYIKIRQPVSTENYTFYFNTKIKNYIISNGGVVTFRIDDNPPVKLLEVDESKGYISDYLEGIGTGFWQSVPPKTIEPLLEEMSSGNIFRMTYNQRGKVIYYEQSLDGFAKSYNVLKLHLDKSVRVGEINGITTTSLVNDKVVN